MSSHTPGPWRQHPEHPDRIIVNGSCVYQVRDMTTDDGFAGNGFGQPNPKDVRVMAAAPELLAVCQRLLEWQSEDDPYSCDDWMEFVTDLGAMAGRAINKAEGRDA